MTLNHPELFLCPACHGGLEPLASGDGLRCSPCDRIYPEEDGVLELRGGEPTTRTRRTVKQFGDSWTEFDHMEGYHEQQFLDWLAPVDRQDFRGRIVLEAGCGKGRHSRAVSGWGPEAVVSVDLSEAVYIAANHNADRTGLTFVHANLLDLPLRDGAFDVAFCVGVLHHLESPEAGLQELWRVVKPGGTLCLWVYGREGNGWIVHLVDPIRKGITSRIPVGVLKWLARPLSAFLWLLLKGIYGPNTAWGVRPGGLPYSAYLGKISPFPFREVDNIVLDHLCPTIAYYLSEKDLRGWFGRLGPESLLLRWHNRMSWTVVARKESDAQRHPQTDPLGHSRG